MVNVLYKVILSLLLYLLIKDIWCGASVFIYNSKNAKIIGNTFKDIVGNYNDAALKVKSDNGQIMNNVFINCTNTNTETGYWAQYGVIYIEGNNILKQNKFVNSSSKMGLIYNNGFGECCYYI